jgi:hypothetical protein
MNDEQVDPQLLEEVEWATGMNGETLMRHLRGHGLDVVWRNKPGPTCPECRVVKPCLCEEGA